MPYNNIMSTGPKFNELDELSRHTKVGEYINTMKTTFLLLSFDF